MISKNPTVIFFVFLVALIGLFLVATWANYQYVQANPGGNDFLIRWLAASRWRVDGTSPYDDALRVEAETSIYGREAAISLDEPRSYFLYPLYAMIFYAPMGLMKYELARAVWMSFLELMAIGSLALGLRVIDWRPPAWLTGFFTLFSIGWYYNARSVIVGQISPIIVFLLILGVYLVKEKQDIGAGIVFAITTIKPGIGLLLIPFALVWAISKKRYVLPISFVISWVALIGISLLFIPDWIFPMTRQWIAIYGYADIRSPVELIGGIVPVMESTLGRILQIVLVLYLLIECALVWGKNERWFVWGAMVTIVISQLVVFRFSTTDHIILILPLLLIFQVIVQRWKAAGYFSVVLVSAGVFVGGVGTVFYDPEWE